MARSSLQKKILAQYRSFMKISWNNPSLKEHIRREFRKYGDSIPRSDFLHIEHILRRGEKQLKMLRKEGVDNVHYVGKKNDDR
jgi:succinate dehydrogenase assembly factor 1